MFITLSFKFHYKARKMIFEIVVHFYSILAQIYEILYMNNIHNRKIPEVIWLPAFLTRIEFKIQRK